MSQEPCNVVSTKPAQCGCGAVTTVVYQVREGKRLDWKHDPEYCAACRTFSHEAHVKGK